MKKLLFGFTAAALAAVMCVGLVGCGGGPDAKSVKGEKVTEEQWTKAIEGLQKDDAVFTIEYLEEQSQKASGTIMGKDMSGTSERTCSITAIKNGSKEYVKMSDEEKSTGAAADAAEAAGEPAEFKEESETYAELKDGKYTVYEQNDDGKWEKDENGHSIIPFRSLISEVGSLNYGDYEYSEENKGYVLKSAGENPYVIKFDKDGRLVAIYCGYEKEYDEMGVSASTSYELNIVITYEADEITIPSV